jgi:hypothetical protein
VLKLGQLANHGEVWWPEPLVFAESCGSRNEESRAGLVITLLACEMLPAPGTWQDLMEHSL